MSSYYTDLSGIVTTGLETVTNVARNSTSVKAGKDLQMEDFLQLMVATFQNQTIDNQADISDMMNQMVQMSVVQAITNIGQLITESTNMTYAASLVGKEVIVAQKYGRSTEQISGVVTGTGNLEGTPVIFMGDKSYWLSDVLAVGKVPSEEAQAENKQSLENAQGWYDDWKSAAQTDSLIREALNAPADATKSLLDAVDRAEDAENDRTDIPAEILEDAVQQIGTN